ncbi:SDR family NAD(P)-dependent oxidoreductase [Kitasatospora sp. RB6PN24]|uniref:SDR family NAD(P)-dependent oxidoreductase n=1 Tax=Kitasatospora humi TaxID=2893891 RepID=UPI001E3A2728|nr:SDR family NAD(P)-dependent oxidoreductase [Kitasatospora humi]MCC9305913.1 SDR family NAD(P)-dependent oxidoreductase [Kitasatospora humi]
MWPMRLTGRNALVTGGSRGLGLLIAEELVARGCRVVLCARDPLELAEAEWRLREQGGEVTAVVCDLTEPGAPERLLDAVRERYGELDVLVNNAGIIQVGPVAALHEEDYRTAWELMYSVPLRLILAALPQMRERRRGVIVNVTSLGGRIPAPHLLPYVGAKFAFTGLSSGLRAELAREGVSVTTVVPGLMRTGSYNAAEFAGQAAREYAWFAVASSLPLLSMDARRAARAIVQAAERGRPELVLTPAAKVAVRAFGLAPATMTRLLSVTARLLPPPGSAPERGVPGSRASQRHDGGVLARLTLLGERAGRRNNEPAAAWRQRVGAS